MIFAAQLLNEPKATWETMSDVPDALKDVTWKAQIEMAGMKDSDKAEYLVNNIGKVLQENPDIVIDPALLLTK